MVPNCNLFESYKSVSSNVTLANGMSIQIAGKGNIRCNSDTDVIVLQALHVPDLGCCLISLGTLLMSGYNIQNYLDDIIMTKPGVGSFVGQVKNQVIELDITLDREVIPR